VTAAAAAVTPRAGAAEGADSVAAVPRTLRITVIAITLALLSACSEREADSPLGVARVDDPLPRLAGETLEGGRLDAAAHADGSVLVINVWADWCGPCRREQPQLVELAERYERRGVRFLGINYQDDRHAARAWVDEFEVPYPSLFDPWGRSAASLGFPALPDTFVVDRQGTIRWVVYGETSERQLGRLIEDVLG
jgi:DsbE subfamily thiol:disulfide oxidoreductase